MITTRIKFHKETHLRIFTGTCSVCGKKYRRQKTFWGTVNPFNRDENGNVKSRAQVHADLVTEADAWKPEHCHAPATPST